MATNAKTLLSNLWQNYRKQVVQVLALSVASALTGSISIVMLVPMLNLLDPTSETANTIGQVFPALSNLSYAACVVLLLVAYALMLLIKAWVDYACSIKQTEFTQTYIFDLRTHLYRWQVESADWEWLLTRRQSDLMNLFTSQCGQVAQLVNGYLSFVPMAIAAAMQLCIALWMSTPLTIAVCVLGALLLVFMRPYMRRAETYGDELIKANRAVYAELATQVHGIKEIRSYGVGERQVLRFEDVSNRLRSLAVDYSKFSAVPKAIYALVAAAAIITVFAAAIFVFKTDTVTLIVLVYIFSRLWPLVSGLYSTLQGIKAATPAYERIREVKIAMEEQAQADDNVSQRPVTFSKSIDFQNVSFAYQGTSEPVLTNATFTIPAGKITALIGPSGVGKSTTVDLLLGFLRPQEGQILIDDTPLNQCTLANWRTIVGYVPQDPLILNDTVRENIARFHPEATDAEIIEALRKSKAWEFVEQMPGQLDAKLGDRGTRLSGGQRQRIVLARVLLGNPRLIVLDEATNALDAQTDAEIRRMMRELRTETAFVIIAHHLSTVQAADRAIVLQEGAVTELNDIKEMKTSKLLQSYLDNVAEAEA